MSSYSEEDVYKLPEPDFTWDVTSELALYQALLVFKPAGINKHFAVAIAADRLTEQLGRSVPASAIWKKLGTMFDLRAVEDREEIIPFSLEVKEFSLPRREFEGLILERRQDWGGSRSRRYFFSHTPSTPKSEGSESRSSPVHSRDLYNEHSEEEDELDSDLDYEFDEEEDLMDGGESTKSDSRPDLEEELDKEKEILIAQARDEIEKSLKEKLMDGVRGDGDGEKPRPSVKLARISEPRTPREEERVAPKRHITRSTPGSTPSSTPNKRRK